MDLYTIVHAELQITDNDYNCGVLLLLQQWDEDKAMSTYGYNTSPVLTVVIAYSNAIVVLPVWAQILSPESAPDQ